ncbi:sodium:solute symporter family protein [Candidatus Peribacteria bacterium]|nr:sodium:solute symporter family protein [Candidatus Peribacteria bacterium]
MGILVAAWFAPKLKWFGDTYGAHTIGDFFSHRYSRASHLVSSGWILLVYLLLTAAQFVGLTALLTVWTGMDFQILIWFAAISTIIYTAFAGIKSDFYTDVIHCIIMFVVLFMVLLPITITDLGDLNRLQELPPSFFNPFAYGGVSFFIAGIVFGIGGIFVTMELWQRVYASTSAKSATRALLYSLAIIILFYAVSTFFGLSMKILDPGLANKNQTLFALMQLKLPSGILGLGIAGFMAIFISTINSTIMVASATLSKDFLIDNSRATKLTEKQKLTYSRMATLICGAVGMGIAAVFPDLITLSVNALFMLLIIVPAVIGGFFWQRATAKGATYSLVAGTITLLLFLFMDAETAFVPAFLVSLVVFVVVSLSTQHAPDEDTSIVKGWL